MRPLSLKGRLILGAVLWTSGLFGVSMLLVTHYLLLHPSAARAIHLPFVRPLTGAVVTALLMLAGLYQVRRGLSLVTQLRTRLSAVHDGRDRRVTGSFPTEVQPLVDDLNGLLALREQTIVRAQAKAADLAHGLKTPLAVLAEDAERARSTGEVELAQSIADQVARMRRQVDYHLAQARAVGASAATRTSVAVSADGLARAVRRLHADRRVTIDVCAASHLRVRVQREDLDEVLGNLIDNACKWARSCVAIAAAADGPDVIVSVDDDGPGIARAIRDAVLQRGVRADESAPGSGLGLAIARDLTELYGGSITLDDSPLGGLRASVKLPAAPTSWPDTASPDEDGQTRTRIGKWG
jgi:signal transduction histidine kinase